VHCACRQGNTALHYAVSQCNVAIMQTLLETGVCDVRRQNRAGYTPIMLASLLIVDADAHRDVIRRLFAVGDVNVKSATVCVIRRPLGTTQAVAFPSCSRHGGSTRLAEDSGRAVAAADEDAG